MWLWERKIERSILFKVNTYIKIYIGRLNISSNQLYFRVMDGIKGSTTPTLPILTTLCPICYENSPKYRCPGCFMRTCSLECFQAHQARASCSGVRDPAKYIPKKFMRSSTIDMDFNFLKSVQKARIEGQDQLRKLSQEKPKTSRRKLEDAKRRRALQKAKERGVDLQNLPRWMERSESNKTRWDPKYNSRVLI